MDKLDCVSGTEMQQLIVSSMKELMWVVSGTVVVEHEQKQEMVDKAYQLVQKFQRDFIVN